MSDLVGDASVSGVVRDIGAAMSGSFLDGAPTVLVDSVTGRGLAELRNELAALTPPVEPTEPTPMRLWIDRSFSMPGAGTVVTGTLTGGPVAIGDTIQASTRRGLHTVRVRGLESFGEASDRLEPGRRAAVSLAGIAHHDLHRGDVLLEPERWHLSSEIDASLEVLSSARAVRSAGAHVLHLGSDEQPARVSVLGARAILPGAHGLIRLRFPRPVPLVPGDRFVLRDSGSWTTVGGGEILDVSPILRTSKARPDRDARRVLAERGWIEADDLERLTGTRIEPVLRGWAVDPGALEQLRDDLRRRALDAGALGLDVARLDDRERAIAESDDELVIRRGRVHPRGVRDAFDGHPYLDQLNAALFAPPSAVEAGIAADDVRELVRRGLAVQEEGIVFSPEAIPAAAVEVAELLARSPQGFSVAELRTRLGTTRRCTVALLGRLDREGVTRRRGDLRIGGPRLPRSGGR
jgi:selenocysteine-specific elongation factor